MRGRLPLTLLIWLFRSWWVPHIGIFILLLVMVVLAGHIVEFLGRVILNCVWIAGTLVLKIILRAFRQMMELKGFYPTEAVNHITRWLSSIRFVLLHEHLRLLTLSFIVNSRFLLIYCSLVLLPCNFLLPANRPFVNHLRRRTYCKCSVVYHSVEILQFQKVNLSIANLFVFFKQVLTQSLPSFSQINVSFVHIVILMSIKLFNE